MFFFLIERVQATFKRCNVTACCKRPQWGRFVGQPSLPFSHSPSSIIKGPIRNHHSPGRCASCWTFASTSSLSDRLRIQTQGKINVLLSAQNLIDCVRTRLPARARARALSMTGIPATRCSTSHVWLTPNAPSPIAVHRRCLDKTIAGTQDLATQLITTWRRMV